MHGSYCRGTVTGEGSNHNSGYFCEVFLQYMFFFFFFFLIYVGRSTWH